MMNKGCCFRLAAWLALSGLPGAGMAEMLPAEEVLLPAPSACRSDRAAVAHLPLRLAVKSPANEVTVKEAKQKVV